LDFGTLPVEFVSIDLCHLFSFSTLEARADSGRFSFTRALPVPSGGIGEYP